MTEAEAFQRLRSLFVAVDAEAHALDASHPVLTDVIHSHQTAPRPKGAYALLTPLGVRPGRDGDQIRYGTATVASVERVVEKRTRPDEIGFRVDVFASRPSTYTDLFRAALVSARAQLELLPAVVANVGLPVEVEATLVQQKWEGRAHFTVTLGATVTTPILIDVIESGSIILESDGQPPAPVDFNYQKV